ncbi:hypothetical protein [Halomonas organivorans]|uniref:hypothetical protein n=1 Tax=Halomonas organivorans TaxID=257772 RepID=UPI003628889F
MKKRKAGSWKLEAGSWKLEAGSWKLEAGSWKLEAGSWKLEGSMNPAIIGSRVFCKLQAYDFKLRAKPGRVFFKLPA